jgi:hypothetical protein
MALELQDINPVVLELYLTSYGLEAHHQSVELIDYRDSVLARSLDDTLRFELVGPSGWQLDASHEDDEGTLITWSTSPRGLAHELPEPTTDFLEVTVTARSSTGESKTKKLYISAKPGGALPDRP